MTKETTHLFVQSSCGGLKTRFFQAKTQTARPFALTKSARKETSPGSSEETATENRQKYPIGLLGLGQTFILLLWNHPGPNVAEITERIFFKLVS